MRTRAWLIVFFVLFALGLSACSDTTGPSPTEVINFPPVSGQEIELSITGNNGWYSFSFLFYTPVHYSPVVRNESSNPAVGKIVHDSPMNTRRDGCGDSTCTQMVWVHQINVSTLSEGTATITASLTDNPNVRVSFRIRVRDDGYCCKGVSTVDLGGGASLRVTRSQ